MSRRRYTTEEFKNMVKEITNGEYVLIGEYVKSKEKTEFLHTSCGKNFL